MANDTVATEPEQPGTRGRNALTWVVVGVAVLAVIIGLVVALTRTGSNPAPPAPGEPDVVIKLAVSSAEGRCMMPTPDFLATQKLAFAATVDSADAGVVTLTPSQFYAGGPADQIQLRYAGSDRISDGSIDFTAGEQVLIAATGGQVLTCGYSGGASPDLTALYQQAFGS